MAASVTPGRALRYAGGSARGLLHQALGHCPVVENLQRVDLSPIEEAEAVARLIDEQGLNKNQAAKLLGKNRLTINQLLKVNGLPPGIRADAAESDVSKSILIELASLKDESLQGKLWKKAQNGNLTVAEIRKARKAEDAPKAAESPTDGATVLDV